MNSFIFQLPTKIYFGKNQLGNLGRELRQYGDHVLLVYGGGSIKRTGLYEQVVTEIKGAGLAVSELSGIEPNPKIDSVRAGVKICKEQEIDVILAVGGGSVIDAAKVIAAGAYVDTDPWDFFEKKTPIEKALPVCTVLTLSATGSEMNKGAVISNPATKDKLAVVSPHLQPRVSFLDPEATFSVSAYQTACGAADSLSHIMESYFNLNDDLSMLDGVMEAMMRSIIQYAPIAMREPDHYEARANLMWAASWAIGDLIRSGRQQAWSCHPMEHGLSAFYDMPHGHGLAILTPRWMEYCLDETTAPKFYQFGVHVFGLDPALPAGEVGKLAIQRLSDFFFRALGLTDTLAQMGVKESDYLPMAQKVCGNGAIPGFKPLTAQDVVNIYNMC